MYEKDIIVSLGEINLLKHHIPLSSPINFHYVTNITHKGLKRAKYLPLHDRE